MNGEKANPVEADSGRPRDHVLLIGIDGYKTQPLGGCVNDALAIREILEQRFSIATGSIQLLASPTAGRHVENALPATANEIRQALDVLASDHVGPDDRVFIYYAGHGGSRLIAGGGDGLRYMIEYLVPADFDASTAHPLLYDTELNRRIASIAQRSANVTVILDCCHSAGATRDFGDPSALGEGLRERRLVLPALDPGSHASLGDGERPDTAWSARGLADRKVDVVTVAACLADQVSFETTASDGTRHGVLTRCLLDVLDSDEAASRTWRELWSGILSGCRPRQNPAFFGDDRRYVLGRASQSEPGEIVAYPTVTGYRIAAGTLVDITPTTTIAVYGPTPDVLPRFDESDVGVRLGTLEVVEASAMEAKARALAPFAWPTDARCRVVNHGAPVLSVSFASPPAEALLDAVRKDPSVRVTDIASAELVLVREGDEWILCDDMHRPRSKGGPELARCRDEDVGSLLQAFIRYRAPLRLAARSTDLPGALQLRLLRVDGSPSDPQAPDLREVPGGDDYRYRLAINEPFCIVVENHSPHQLRSVALLNCGSSGAVEHIAALQLPAQGRHVLWAAEELGTPFRLEGPVGLERLVAVGSTRAGVDWRFLATSTGFRDLGRNIFKNSERPTELYTATTVAVRVFEAT